VEIDDCDFIVSLGIYYGGIVHVLFNCIISNEARILYYGFIAKFYWLI
jgi:hypothetical protein